MTVSPFSPLHINRLPFARVRLFGYYPRIEVREDQVLIGRFEECTPEKTYEVKRIHDRRDTRTLIGALEHEPIFERGIYLGLILSHYLAGHNKHMDLELAQSHCKILVNARKTMKPRHFRALMNELYKDCFLECLSWSKSGVVLEELCAVADRMPVAYIPSICRRMDAHVFSLKKPTILSTGEYLAFKSTVTIATFRKDQSIKIFELLPTPDVADTVVGMMRVWNSCRAIDEADRQFLNFLQRVECPVALLKHMTPKILNKCHVGRRFIERHLGIKYVYKDAWGRFDLLQRHKDQGKSIHGGILILDLLERLERTPSDLRDVLIERVLALPEGGPFESLPDYRVLAPCMHNEKKCGRCRTYAGGMFRVPRD